MVLYTLIRAVAILKEEKWINNSYTLEYNISKHL